MSKQEILDMLVDALMYMRDEQGIQIDGIRLAPGATDESVEFATDDDTWVLTVSRSE